MSGTRGTLTKEQRQLCADMERLHGIKRDTTRCRILLGWPVGRLHEQPVTDPVRAARTRRYTTKCIPRADHPLRKWNGPEHLNRRLKTNPET